MARDIFPRGPFTTLGNFLQVFSQHFQHFAAFRSILNYIIGLKQYPKSYVYIIIIIIIIYCLTSNLDPY